MSRILCTGGCGYIGSVLVPKLLAEGHEVDVCDIGWFGFATKGTLLAVGDFRQLTNLRAYDTVIHLAAVANDPVGELDPKLTWETNALGTMQIADLASRSLVKQFIYASSGSVYGVSTAAQITEDLPLDPISDYNKTKMVAERCVLSYAERMQVQIVRPGTVCGWSPRMRLDVIINRQTMQALTKKKITVLGGPQMRPHIHIDDMTDLYCWLVRHPEVTGIYNAAFENYSVDTSAIGVAIACEATVDHAPSNDLRSYRMNSEKLLRAGFTPRYRIMDAVKDMQERFEAGELKESDECHNILTMQKRLSVPA